MSLMALHYLGFGFRYHSYQNETGKSFDKACLNSSSSSRGIQTADADAVEKIS
jgi:hypothetical protein